MVFKYITITSYTMWFWRRPKIQLLLPIIERFGRSLYRNYNILQVSLFREREGEKEREREKTKLERVVAQSTKDFCATPGRLSWVINFATSLFCDFSCIVSTGIVSSQLLQHYCPHQLLARCYGH